MLLFGNIRRLYRGVRAACRAPDVQGVGALAFALILVASGFYCMAEGWSPLDAVYFSVATIATVGYGDLAPKTAIGKIFTIVYIFAGIGIFVAAVTTFAQAVLRAEPPQDD